MKPLVIYKRLSKESKKNATNLGLHAQQSAIDSYLSSLKSPTILQTFEEIETGTNKRQRPQLHAALQLCKAQNATLVIAKLDRLARNVFFVSGLMESRVDFVALDMKEATPLTIHILAAVAEAEAKTISARTKAAVAEAKKQGKKPGNPQHLYLPQAEEGRQHYHARRRSAALKFAEKVYPSIAYYKQQGLSNAKVAEELNKIGLVAPSGKAGAWNLTNVGKCINRVSQA